MAGNRIDPVSFPVEAVRRDFPILSRRIHGKPLVFLDSGASAQKPEAVLASMRRIYEDCYANVHRGAYWLAEAATSAYEEARGKIAAFLHAASEREVIFTAGATAALNLIAQSYGRRFLRPGDEIVVSALEHHSNIVPWQMLRDEKDLVLRVAPIFDDGTFDVEAFAALLGPRTKIVAFAHVSNVLGAVLPVREICRMARAAGAATVVDGCQGIVHDVVDVQDMGCDFYVFSGHKLYGPGGVGVLWGREERLEAMPPWQGGGDMIASVSFEKSVWADPPSRFEAGTPPIVPAIGLGAAVDYVCGLGREAIHAHESALLAYAMERLGEIEGLKVFGTTPNKSAIISFSMREAHPHDVATVLDRRGVCVRAGHHCAQPLMRRLGVTALTRASMAAYNDRADVDALCDGLRTVQAVFA